MPVLDDISCNVSISNQPEYASTITRYFIPFHSKMSALTCVHGNSGVGWLFMGSFVWCGLVLLQGTHEDSARSMSFVIVGQKTTSLTLLFVASIPG